MIRLEDRQWDLFLGNGMVQPAHGGRSPVHDPATGELLGHAAAAGPADAERAATEAHAAFRAWAALDPAERGRHLHRWAQVLWQHRDHIAQLDTRNQGKTLRESRADVAFGIRTLEYYAGAADKLQGDQIPVPGPRVALTLREPLGVTVHFSPWNYAFSLSMRSIAPALAAGNTAILKPATLTPLAPLALASAAAEAGLPAGVLGVLTGSGELLGPYLLDAAEVAAASFTGGADAGVEVATRAGARLLPLTLELGGKCPNIVLDDADLERAAAGVVQGAFLNAGQMCWAGSRLLVHERVAEPLVARVVRLARELRVGPGIDPETRMGPLVSAEHRARVAEAVAAASQDGKVLTGGSTTEDRLRQGHFLPPTVMSDLPQGHAIAQEEVFGPVLTVHPFADDTEALRIANGVPYGLYAGIWSRSLERALTMSRGLETGMVSVNEYPVTFPQTPFGGWKRSGLGFEQGLEGLERWSRVKTVTLRHG